MSKSLIELLEWVDNVTPKSTAKTKKLQKQLVELIELWVPSLPGPLPMTIGEPISLQVDMQNGIPSWQHFIGGEEVNLVSVSVMSRTYKVMLEFAPNYASDIKAIKIPLSRALTAVSGLEIRMLGAVNLTTAIKDAYELNIEHVVKQVDRAGSQYDAIGYGTW